MITTSDIVACARMRVGKPFAHQGRGEQGLDCLGLLLDIAHELRLPLRNGAAIPNDIPTYGARPDALLLKARLDEVLEPVMVDALHPADIVLLKVDGSPRHLAILSDYPMHGELGMIHAYAPARQVIEHRYDAYWRAQTYAAYRLPRVTYNVC